MKKIYIKAICLMLVMTSMPVSAIMQKLNYV